MIISIDESGCSGFKFRKGSTKFFTIGSVIVKDQNLAQTYATQVENLRFSISPDFKEFHFSKDGHRTRMAFLDLICSLDLEMYLLVVDKERVKGDGFKVKSSFYKCLFGYALNNFSNKLQNAEVILDKCSNDSFEAEVSKNLAKKFPNTLTIKHECSQKNDLLQIADYLASITRKYAETNNQKSKKYFEKIFPKVVHIQSWPS